MADTYNPIEGLDAYHFHRQASLRLRAQALDSAEGGLGPAEQQNLIAASQVHAALVQAGAQVSQVLDAAK